MTDTNEQETPQIKSITSIDQISRIIKKNDIAYTSHFMVPSLKKEVAFNEINTSQQKRLIKSIIDSPVYNTEFIYTLREILRENCQDETVNIDSLNIIDKLVLAMALRLKSVGNNVEVEIETKDKKKVNVTLNIFKILQSALATLTDISPITVEDSYYVVECSLPTIGEEYKAEKELRNKSSKIEIDNLEEARQTIGDAFISEITKYISDIKIKTQENELIQVQWQQFTYLDRIKVVETFKTGILKEIIDYISNVRKEIDKIELVNFEFEGETYERRLSIDGSFFTIS